MHSLLPKQTERAASSAGLRPPAPVFLAVLTVIFFSSLSAADSIGFVPYYIDGSTPLDSAQGKSLTTGGTAPRAESIALSNLPELGEDPAAVAEKEIAVNPARITIDAIDLDLPIQNPGTRDISALDELLKSGPARFVDSAQLGVGGNVLIFAHSSHLPVVRNPMYKAFNKIPDLSAGDSIVLTGEDGKKYLYRVVSIATADATDTKIDLAVEGKRLTLVTCDTLTGKSSRFVLTADFIGVL